MYLDASAQGEGTGEALMKAAEDWAKEAGYQQLYLETHSNLHAAMKLYEKAGFQQIERPAAVCHGTMDYFFEEAVSRRRNPYEAACLLRS